MQFAPTFVANFVAFVFLLTQLFGWDIPYTPEQVEQWLTMGAILLTPLFTLFRQWWTGRSTLIGTRAKA